MACLFWEPSSLCGSQVAQIIKSWPLTKSSLLSVLHAFLISIDGSIVTNTCIVLSMQLIKPYHHDLTSPLLDRPQDVNTSARQRFIKHCKFYFQHGGLPYGMCQCARGDYLQQCTTTCEELLVILISTFVSWSCTVAISDVISIDRISLPLYLHFTKIHTTVKSFSHN